VKQQDKRMLFAVDIDGTIAKGDGKLASYAQFLNQVAGFGLPDAFFADDMDQDAYSEAVKASGVTKEILERARELKQYDPTLQERCLPIPGAVEAMHQFANMGKLIYITVRMSFSETLTRSWLARCGFPNSSECYCCSDFYHKIRRAYEEANDDEPIVIIDDLAYRVAWTMALAQRAEPDVARSLWHRLALVPFGTRPEVPLARHLTHFMRPRIASWEKDVMQAFLKEVQDYELVRRN
jgi:hypothetical protein